MPEPEHLQEIIYGEVTLTPLVYWAYLHQLIEAYEFRKTYTFPPPGQSDFHHYLGWNQAGQGFYAKTRHLGYVNGAMFRSLFYGQPQQMHKHLVNWLPKAWAPQQMAEFQHLINRSGLWTPGTMMEHPEFNSRMDGDTCYLTGLRMESARTLQARSMFWPNWVPESLKQVVNICTNPQMDLDTIQPAQ